MADFVQVRLKDYDTPSVINVETIGKYTPSEGWLYIRDYGTMTVEPADRISLMRYLETYEPSLRDLPEFLVVRGGYSNGGRNAKIEPRDEVVSTAAIVAVLGEWLHIRHVDPVRVVDRDHLMQSLRPHILDSQRSPERDLG